MTTAALRLTTAADPTPAASPVRDWSQWVRIDKAAGLLEIHPSNLTRRCQQRLEGEGVAVKTQAPGDSQVAWWIHRRHDTRLEAPAETPRVPTLEELGHPADKAAEARQRRDCVDELRRWRSSRRDLQAQWLPVLIDELRRRHDGLRISRTRLMEWDKVYRAPADLELLVDRRGGNPKARRVSPEAWDYFAGLYLDDRRPTVAECWRKTDRWARAQGMAWCAKRTCQSQLDERISPAAQAHARDRALYNSKFLPTLAQDTERFAAGRCWVADHTTLDFAVRVPANNDRGWRSFRPTLTTFQDWRTRRIVGWCMGETPSSDTILLALRDGLLDPVNMGGPTEVCFDNGKDFDSQTFDARTKRDRQRGVHADFAVEEGGFRGVLGELGIKPHFSIAYAPNGKARMERWYGTLHDQFCRSMPSYVGKDTASKPDGLASRVAAGNLPTYAEARERLSHYIKAYNASDEHQIADLVRDGGGRLSPDQAMATWCTTQRVYNAGALDLLLLHHDRAVTVGKQGVRVTVAGETYYYGLMAPELIAYQHTRRKVRAAYDPTDLRTAHIFDDQTKQLICVARSNDVGGQDGPIGRQQMAAFKRRVREHGKQLKAAGLGGLIPAASASALELLRSDGKQPPPPEPVSESIQPVATAYDGQDRETQRHRLKAAAGAEHDEMPKPSGRDQKPDRRDVLDGVDPIGRLDEDRDELGPIGRIAPEDQEDDLGASPDGTGEQQLDQDTSGSRGSAALSVLDQLYDDQEDW